MKEPATFKSYIDDNYFGLTSHVYSAIKRHKKWFWCASLDHYGYPETSEFIEGWAATEEEAIQSARDALLKACPQDIVGVYCPCTARMRYKVARRSKHKNWRTAAKGTIWEDRFAVWTNYYSVGLRPVPIINLTEKFVYIPNWWEIDEYDWRSLITKPRVERVKYLRLDRQSLETKGSYYAWDHADGRFSVEPDLSNGKWAWNPEDGYYSCLISYEDWATAQRMLSYLGVEEAEIEKAKLPDISVDLKTTNQDIKNLRRLIQENHPWHGGDIDEFLQAKADLAHIESFMDLLKTAAA